MNTTILFNYAVRALVMLIAIPVHECAHALVSYWLGDDTAKRHGRLTLNPFAHLDLLGVACMVLAGVGWAKPVPIYVAGFKRPRLGMAVSALAGPVSNIILAFISTIIYKSLYYMPAFGDSQKVILVIFETMIIMNISLAVFNMIPVPPLDGSRIFLLFLPKHLYFGLMKYERYMMLALFVALMAGFLDTPLYIARSFLTQLLFDATTFVDMIFLSVPI